MCKLLIGFLLLSMLFSTSCAHRSNSDDFSLTNTNRNVITFQDFALDAASVGQNTRAGGTIFVKKDDNNPNLLHAQIAAFVEIDSSDWGGVGFSIRKGWQVTAVVSDYPQGRARPQGHTATLRGFSDDGIPFYIVQIGNNFSDGHVIQGGRGSVIIELESILVNQTLPETLEISIGVGSKSNIQGPVHTTITIPISGAENGTSPTSSPTGTSGKTEVSPVGPLQLEKEDFTLLKAGMTEAEVEAIVGKEDGLSPIYSGRYVPIYNLNDGTTIML